MFAVNKRPMWCSGRNTRLLRKSLHDPCLFVLGLGVYMFNMYLFTKKVLTLDYIDVSVSVKNICIFNELR
jgi:hypothetical protein